MTGKTHLGIGVMSTVIMSQFLPYELTLGAIGISGVSSLLPDIDHPKSIINKYLLPFRNNTVRALLAIVLGVLLLVFDYFYFNKPYLKCLGGFIIMVGASSHRDGSTHSLAGALVFIGLFNYFAVNYGLKGLILPFMIGFISHLSADFFTNKGILMFYPFNNKYISAPFTIKTGSKFGKAIEGFILSAGFVYIVIKLPYLISRLK